MMDVENTNTAAIVLAAGQGKRMGGNIPKQYRMLMGKPLIYYALKAFQESLVDRIVLVTGQGECDYCKKEIADKYNFSKISHIVEGGKERYHSVYKGLECITHCSYVLIHDGARPFVNAEIIERAVWGARTYDACVIGMPVKDTIKVSDGYGFAHHTPDRNSLWMIQTPQAFSYLLIKEAYEKLFEDVKNQAGITDDAMVVETMTHQKVKLLEGSYENIKVTTPEDMAAAEAFLQMSESLR